MLEGRSRALQTEGVCAERQSNQVQHWLVLVGQDGSCFVCFRRGPALCISVLSRCFGVQRRERQRIIWRGGIGGKAEVLLHPVACLLRGSAWQRMLRGRGWWLGQHGPSSSLGSEPALARTGSFLCVLTSAAALRWPEGRMSLGESRNGSFADLMPRRWRWRLWRLD